ncbi:phage recombination protein Bet [Pseudomonas sp. PS1]|uniref:Phage recombination protein Bet n=1 Tax=Stutzerimonas marianensis TaxID=2929513 RepID=A0A9X1W0Q1_9GAMM|nr:phage recombination protein Bet [Pseudomonas marianensis]MCJ0972721.1 phage recombination protein Bet [Pseudomonas marianensis]
MSNVATLKPASLASRMADRFGVDPNEMMQTLKATAFKGQVSDAQMQALLIVADQYGLNPWTKEIYAFPDKGGIVPVVGVDGWSRIINENGAFDGMDFQQDDESCTCIIYRKDRNHPIKVTEWMAECKRNTQPWQSHPKRMLRHKAMIQCARLAFGYTGIFDEDEAQRITEKDVTPSASEPDITPALESIQNASSMEELHAAFKAAWNQHPAARARLTAVKDERKKALSEPIEGELVEKEDGAN